MLTETYFAFPSSLLMLTVATGFRRFSGRATGWARARRPGWTRARRPGWTSEGVRLTAFGGLRDVLFNLLHPVILVDAIRYLLLIFVLWVPLSCHAPVW